MPLRIGLTLLLFISLSMAFIPDAHAQWPRGEGQGYAQVSVGGAAASQGFNGNRDLGPLGSVASPEEYSETAIYAYLEYGLTDRLTFIASTFGKQARGENLNLSSTSQTGGLSDLMVDLRYTVFKLGAFVFSPQIGVKIPTFYDDTDAPPLGSGEVDVRAGATLGISFYPIPAYMSLGGGYNARGGIPKNEIYGYLESGVSITSAILLRGRADFIESTANTTSDFSMLAQVAEQGYLNAGPGLSVQVAQGWQIHADARWTVAGRTTADLNSFVVGLAYTW